MGEMSNRGIYVFLYQNLNAILDTYRLENGKIYVFLYQNLNAENKFITLLKTRIYVFLYQNLNKIRATKENYIMENLCISILEFKWLY